MMAQAETEAITRGCRSMWLDTYAFQARGFYERLGFSVFGQIDGPPPMFPSAKGRSHRPFNRAISASSPATFFSNANSRLARSSCPGTGVETPA